MKKFGLFAIFAFTVSAALILFACSSRDESSAKTPVGLKATVTGNYVEVVWNKVENAVEYKVYRKDPQPSTSTAATALYDFVLVSTQSDTSYLDVDVTAAKAQQYLYRVSSLDAKGNESPMTNSVMTRCVPAGAPANVRATSQLVDGGTKASITVQWTQVVGANSYKVYYSDKKFAVEKSEEGEETEEDPTVLVKTVGNTNSLVITDGLLATKYYYFKVKAVTTCGESEFSDYDSASTGCISPKTAGGIKAEAISDKAIKISWNTIENATDYRLEVGRRNGIGAANNISWNDLAKLQTTSYTHNVGSAAVTRYYRVRGINNCGQGADPVEIDSATTKCQYAPSNQVLGVSGFDWDNIEIVAHAVSKDQIDVTWEEHFDRGVTGYEVFHSATGNGNTFKLLAKVSGRTNTRFEHKELKPSTDNYYKIKAVNDCGAGSLTDKTGFDKTLADCDEETPLTAPTGLEIDVDYAYATIFFNLHPNADYYKIYRSTVNPENTPEGRAAAFANGLVATQKLPYFEDELLPNTTYYYSVKAVNSCKESDFSPEVSVKTDCLVPSGIAEFDADRVTETKAALTWNKVTNATSYEIYRSENGGRAALRPLTPVTVPALDLEGETLIAIDTDLNPALYYTYTIYAVNSCGKTGSLGSSNVSKWHKADCDDANRRVGNPGAITTTIIGANTIRLSWTNVTNAASYKVYRSNVNNWTTAALITAEPVKGRSYDDAQKTDAEGNITHAVNSKDVYYYFLSAVDSCGKETPKYSGSATGTVICGAFSGAVSEAGIKADSTATSIKLTWLPLAGAQKYIVRKFSPSPTQLENGLTIGDVLDKANVEGDPVWPAAAAGDTVSAATKTFGELTASTYHWFKITALNYCNDTSSASTLKETHTIFPQLGAVTGFTVTPPPADGDPLVTDRLTLKWAKNSGAREATSGYGYVVHRATTENGTFIAIANVNQPTDPEVTEVTYVNTGLTQGTTYWYRVTAVNKIGAQGVNSAKVSATTRGTPPAKPNAPTIVGPASVTEYVGNSSNKYVTVQFNYTGEGITGGVIQYSTDGGQNWYNGGGNMSNGVISWSTYIDAGSTYRFRASVTNPAGTSVSATKTITVQCAPIPTITLDMSNAVYTESRVYNVRIEYDGEDYGYSNSSGISIQESGKGYIVGDVNVNYNFGASVRLYFSGCNSGYSNYVNVYNDQCPTPAPTFAAPTIDVTANKADVTFTRSNGNFSDIAWEVTVEIIDENDDNIVDTDVSNDFGESGSTLSGTLLLGNLAILEEDKDYTVRFILKAVGGTSYCNNQVVTPTPATKVFKAVQ